MIRYRRGKWAEENHGPSQFWYKLVTYAICIPYILNRIILLTPFFHSKFIYKIIFLRWNVCSKSIFFSSRMFNSKIIYTKVLMYNSIVGEIFSHQIGHMNSMNFISNKNYQTNKKKILICNVRKTSIMTAKYFMWVLWAWTQPDGLPSSPNPTHFLRTSDYYFRLFGWVVFIF